MSDGHACADDAARRTNRCWSLDFVSAPLNSGRRFRVLTVVDDYTRANARRWWRIRRCQASGSAGHSTGSGNIAAGH